MNTQTDISYVLVQTKCNMYVLFSYDVRNFYNKTIRY